MRQFAPEQIGALHSLAAAQPVPPLSHHGLGNRSSSRPSLQDTEDVQAPLGMEEPPFVTARSTAVSCDEAVSVLGTRVNRIGDCFASASAPARNDTLFCHCQDNGCFVRRAHPFRATKQSPLSPATQPTRQAQRFIRCERLPCFS